MQISTPKKIWSVLALSIAIVLSSCKKEEAAYEYVVNNEDLYQSATLKDKLKTNEQWVSILYANMFQQALSANEIFEISLCIESIGDKQLAREVIISNFMNKPGVIMPTDSAMRADVDVFIDETYRRFLVRNPTEGERTWYRNYIMNDPNITPELVYFSFALSDEYLYY